MMPLTERVIQMAFQQELKRHTGQHLTSSFKLYKLCFVLSMYALVNQAVQEPGF